jgi:hypothetical protein
MKCSLFLVCSFVCFVCSAQTPPIQKKVFIITMDGFRWQEVFKGADPILIRDTSVVKDTTLMLQQYWSNDPEAVLMIIA